MGTPDYIAPEVFSQNGYTETVDWWSVGVILFEMLVGYPPFFSDDPSMTCQKILHWKKIFNIPSDANLSQPAADLIKRLITDANERLGINGVEEIKAHPFFYGVDWKKIREQKAPYIPQVPSRIPNTDSDSDPDSDPTNLDFWESYRSVRIRLPPLPPLVRCRGSRWRGLDLVFAVLNSS